MYAGITNPALFERAIRSGGARQIDVTFTDRITGTATPLTGAMRPLDGQTVDSATSNTRRTLSLTLPNRQAIWDMLDTVGGELAPVARVKYAPGRYQDVPMGVFVVTGDSYDYDGQGVISIDSAPDQWGGRVAPATIPLGQRASIRTNTVAQEIKRLVEGAFTASFPFPGWSNFDTTIGLAKVGPLLWDDGNRETAILDMLTSISAQVLFDRVGMAVFRPVPTITSSTVPAFTANAGAGGVLVGANRQRDRAGIANVVIATTTAPDVTFAPQAVANTTPGDPLNTSGYLGYRAVTIEGNYRNSAQARAAAQTRLPQVLAVAQKVSFDQFRHFGLDSEDVMQVIYPKTDLGLARPAELHILDTITTEFKAASSQSMDARSTRPGTDGT